MRIFVAGSIPTYPWEATRDFEDQEMPFVAAARDLGREAARRGHTVIASDDHPGSLDAQVVAGMVEHLEAERGATATLVVNRSEGSRQTFLDLPPALTVERNFHTEIGAEVKGTGSLIPNLASLDMCDVVMLMGGGITTRIVGSVGADRDENVIAIPPFGGSASELYEKLKYSYKSAVGRDHPGLSALTSVWDATSADRILDMAEVMCAGPNAAAPHSYFLSYRWTNSAEADHVELLLRRFGRMVLRDESMFDAGANLSDTIKSMIGAADTFVALHSADYDESDYCPGELDYAVRRARKGERPGRVVLMAIESYDPDNIPIQAGGRLWKPGVTRPERDLSVREIVESEQTS